MKLGIVCPMANEAATAVPFVDAVLEQCGGFDAVDFFVVLDNVSRDETRSLLEALDRPELHVVWAPENRGVADAYVRGYREALAAGCDWILEIDAGFSHAPTDIPQFFAELRRGRDCVFGTRFSGGGRNLGTRRRRLISRCGTVAANVFLGTRLSDMTSGFELFTRPALEHVLSRGIRSKGPFFQTEIKVHCRNLRVAEVPISYNAGSHAVGGAAVRESLANLGRMVALRLRGKL